MRTLLEEQLPCAGPDVAGWGKSHNIEGNKTYKPKKIVLIKQRGGEKNQEVKRMRKEESNDVQKNMSANHLNPRPFFSSPQRDSEVSSRPPALRRFINDCVK